MAIGATRAERAGAATRIGAAVGGGVVLLLGLAIGWQGGELLLLGGTPYYLAAGLGLIATGVLLILRRSLAGLVYAAVLLVTLVWAFSESGFRFWPLIPRLVGPAILGLLVWALLGLAPRGADRHRAALACGGLSVLSLVVVLLSMVPLFSWGQAKTAVAAAAAPAAAAPAGDWRYYGRDPAAPATPPSPRSTQATSPS